MHRAIFWLALGWMATGLLAAAAAPAADPRTITDLSVEEARRLAVLSRQPTRLRRHR